MPPAHQCLTEKSNERPLDILDWPRRAVGAVVVCVGACSCMEARPMSLRDLLEYLAAFAVAILFLICLADFLQPAIFAASGIEGSASMSHGEKQ
jgi:hypothetical protein